MTGTRATVTAMGATNASPPKLTERELQDNIVALCRWLGLLCYHTHDSRHSAAGFPDLVIVGKHVIFVELKSASGDLSKAQGCWRDALQESDNGNFRVWRPADWWSGSIRAQLEAVMHRAEFRAGIAPRPERRGAQ